MEIKDGRITPTTKQEVKIFSRLLREQEAACYRNPELAAEAEVGEELAKLDSYKLFSAMERAYNAPDTRPKKTSQEEALVMGKTIAALAIAYAESLDLENLREQAPTLFTAPEEGKQWVFGFAAHALSDRYGD